MRMTYPLAALAGLLLIVFVVLTSGDYKNRYDGGYKDIVDELYDQAVKQSESLEALEESIEKFYKKKQESLEKYNSYTSYNSRYYSDARTRAASITDATTRQKAIDRINSSESRYKASMAGWDSQMASLNAGEKELKDLHALLKIMTSEQLINKYQPANFPDNSKLKETTNDLQSVIEKIRSITR